MSTDTISGKFDQLKGQAKQSIGEATGNDSLANEGAMDQVKGNAKEAWGNTKDAAHSVSADAQAHAEVKHEQAKVDGEHKAHDLRDSIVNAAEKIKNAVVNHTDDVKANH